MWLVLEAPIRCRTGGDRNRLALGAGQDIGESGVKTGKYLIDSLDIVRV